MAVDGAAARGILAAASHEAREFNLRSAMPSVTAMRKCPALIVVQPGFEVYRAVAEQIRKIFADYTPIIEPFSLDEAHLDVTENLKDMPIVRSLWKSGENQGGDRTECLGRDLVQQGSGDNGFGSERRTAKR